MVCEPQQEPEMSAKLKVNGKEIELNSFVQDFFSHSLIGMVKSLRGVEQVETVCLEVSKKAPVVQ